MSRQLPHAPASRPLVLGLTMVPALLNGPTVSAQTVTLQQQVIGQTPNVIGINSGNFLPEGNSSTFYRWLGVNGSRTFTSAPNIEPANADDIPGVGDGVNSQASFLARREAVRANPTDPSLINFAAFENNYRNNESDFINYDFAYSEFEANDINALAIINRTNNQFPIADIGSNPSLGWAQRYEHWQHYYAQAYYLGDNHGVERFSVFNEPDASSQNISQEEFLLRLQLASDAIQAALADVNRDNPDRNLEANVIAPITAGGANEYFRRLDNSDTRDDQQGWGELVINNLNTNFLGEVDPNFQLIHTYGYQQYNADGRRYADDLEFLQNAVANDLAANNLVGEIEFGLTEFNVHSNGVFADRDDDLNTPSRYARLGGIFVGLANQQADELYVFKFDSNAEDDFFQGNAIFSNTRFAEGEEGPYDVGGASAAAGVLKLFTKGFVGGQELLAEADESRNNSLFTATSYNPDEDIFYLLSANEGDGNSGRNLTFDLSELGVEAGAIVQIEEVSDRALAEVTHRIVVGDDLRVNVPQDSESVLLLSVPRTAPDQVVTLTASDDATVLDGSASSTNFGSSRDLFVRNVNDGPDGRAVGLVQFDTQTITPDTAVERAVLQLHGEINEGNAEYVTTHVFGIVGDDFDESSITFDTTNNLETNFGTVTEIADNFVTGLGETAEFLGHLTVGQDFGSVSLDVTDFLQLHAGADVSFLIAREVRFEGDEVDRSDGAVRFDSNNNASGLGPQLILELRDIAEVAALAGDYNGDGFVGQADLDLVLLNFGDNDLPEGFNTAALPGATFDGLIGQNELDAVLLNFGSGTTTPLSLNVIPEPGTAALVGVSLVALMRRRDAASR